MAWCEKARDLLQEAGYDVQFRLLKGKRKALGYYPKLELSIWKQIKNNRSGIVSTRYGTTYVFWGCLFYAKNRLTVTSSPAMK